MPPKPLPAELRFWRFVQKSEDCWLWTGWKDRPGGYGCFCPAHGSKVKAHRFAYEMLVGPIPAGLDLDHLCRVRTCVNPAHLEPVTRRENLRRGKGHGSEVECPQGHPYDETNTGFNKDGSRYCRLCARDKARLKRDWKGHEGQGMANSMKTSCPYGHLYDETNTYTGKDGRRSCLTCRRERDRQRRRGQTSA